MPSGKRRVHSVSGRHDDDRWRNASDFLPEGIHNFFSDLSQVPTEIPEVNTDMAQVF